MGPTVPTPWHYLLCRYLVCSGQAELWDWTTSILKAQVSAGWSCHPDGQGWGWPGVTPVPTLSLCTAR